MPKTITLETMHASAVRTEDELLRERHQRLQEYASLSLVLDAMPQFVAILDENRQIVAANSKLLETFAEGQIEKILGNRPGEMIGCRNARNAPGGCGTSEACRTCGAVNAILGAQSGQVTSDSCQISLGESGDSLDLNVTASPATVGGQLVTILSVQDAADENRRKVLERTFFHDVLNSAGGALGIANVLVEAESMDEVREFAPLLVFVMDQLINEIHSQRDMLAAEQGELSVQMGDFGSVQLLMEVLNTYASHPVAEGRTLELAPSVSDYLVHTSKTLLQRVLGNMTKNAIEATATGGTVRLGCDREADEVCFWVNNPEVMPRATQLQVFNRSFSTKGPGRGIGTYSIRLLGEKYLGGRVSFDSTEGQGTTFRIHLPVRPSTSR